MVPLTAELVRIFKQHRTLHIKELTELRNSGRLREDLVEKGLDDLVFTRHHNGNVWTPSDDHQVFKQLLQEANVSKDYRLHDLRHTSVSHLVENTANISTAQAIAGHKTIITTQKYVNQDLAALLKDLNTSNKALERGKNLSQAKKQKKAKKMAAAGE
jgi:site-specific recombinase XerD